LLFGIILPFAALVFVGGILTYLLIRRGIGEVKGLWQTTSAKNPPKVVYEKPAPQEVKTQYKPLKQNTQEENLPAKMNEGNSENAHPWRW